MADASGNLTVLGCSPSWQNVGEACSSYLVDAPGTRLLLDCGNGAFSRLREHRDYLSVDTIAITHTHGDHMLDLLPFAYALLYSPRALRVSHVGHDCCCPRVPPTASGRSST